MSADNCDTFYGVHEGRRPGVYRSWAECKEQVNGFKGPMYKKFKTYNDALQYVKDPKFVALKIKNPSSARQSHQSHQSHQNSRDQYLQQCQIPNSVIIYTDGACTHNGLSNAQAGIGVFFGDDDPRNISEPVPEGFVKSEPQIKAPTNQLAELYAIARAMEVCVADSLVRNQTILLYTDSRYSINCLTKWITTWEKNRWILTNGHPVKHQALIKSMKEQMNHLNITFCHVAGHKGIYGNEMADELAVSGAARYQCNTTP